MEPLLSIRGLRVTFPTAQGPFEALSDVDLDIGSGESLALMGESGCGKSVLGHAIMRLLDRVAEVEGSIQFRGREIASLDQEGVRSLRGGNLALVPQSPSLAFDPVIRIGKQIDEMHVNDKHKVRADVRRSTMERLGRVGFNDTERIYRLFPHQMSGGMCERALIAMATALSPELLIADEPTKGLDTASKIDVLRLLKTESRDRSMILITHDHKAPRICGRTAIMYAGEIVEIGPTREILESPAHPYTIGLWRSLPERGLQTIPGSMVLLRDGGCRFRNRCPRSSDECAERQSLIQISQDHFARCCRA